GSIALRLAKLCALLTATSMGSVKSSQDSNRFQVSRNGPARAMSASPFFKRPEISSRVPRRSRNSRPSKAALLQKRHHASAKFGKMGDVAFAPEESLAKLLLQLFDRARERGLGNITFLGGAGEVEQASHCKEISDLVHLHRWPSSLSKAR